MKNVGDFPCSCSTLTTLNSQVKIVTFFSCNINYMHTEL